jgi:hypothetical protein
MHQGGVAGNPLDSYGDFLSNQINNTQVEPFIQEIQQMASQRFNLDNSGGLKTFLEPTIFEPPQDLSRPKMEVAEPLLQPFNPIMQRPVAPFQMQGLGQPMRDKDGILRQSIFQEPVKREPMGLRGGPNHDMIRTLDQQIFNDGFMPGSEQLLGGLPRTFDDGGEVQNFFSGGEIDSFVDDQDSGNNFSGGNNNDDDDGFSFDDDVSDYQTDDSGVYTGGDDQSIALPTPRPQILLDAVGRAENEIFGGTESDALGFFNKSGGLSNKGQKAFEESIVGNLAALQDPPDQVAPSGGGLQLASLLDSSLLGDAKNTTPGDISRGAFGITPTTIDRKANTVLDNLKLDDLSLINQRPDVLSTRASLPALPSTTTQKTAQTDDIQKAFERSNREGVQIPANISFRDLIQATTPGTPEYEATKGGDLTSIISPPGSSGVFGTPLMERNLQQTTTPSVDQGIVPVGEFDVKPPATSPAPVDEGILPVGEFNVRSPIDPFAIQPTFQNIGLPGAGNLPTVGSTRSTVAQDQARAIANLVGDRKPTIGEQLQQNILEERGRALGPTTFSDDLANFSQNVVGQQPTVDTVFDIDTTSIQPTSQSAGVQELLDRGAAAQRQKNQAEQDNLAARQSLGVGIPPIDATNLQSRNVMGRDITQPIDPNVSIVGDDVEPELDVADIVGDVTQERVADILNRPEAFKSTFKIGDAEFPSLLAAIANKAGSFFDRRLFDGIVSKGLDAVVDPDTGRIIGAKDEFGNLIEGRDLEQFQAGDDNEDPIKKFLEKATEEEEEEDKPPNVIGGGVPVPVRDPDPTVVKSKFPESTASFTPVDFSAGNLNDLIERITGVKAPRSLQDGGAVGAVDRFLSKVA